MELGLGAPPIAAFHLSGVSLHTTHVDILGPFLRVSTLVKGHELKYDPISERLRL